MLRLRAASNFKGGCGMCNTGLETTYFTQFSDAIKLLTAASTQPYNVFLLLTKDR